MTNSRIKRGLTALAVGSALAMAGAPASGLE